MTEEYQGYLKSPEWQKKRSERLRIDDFKCQKCGKTSGLHVHHINYDNIGKENVYEDLITLCGECHQEIHKKIVSKSKYQIAEDFWNHYKSLDSCWGGRINICDLKVLHELRDDYLNSRVIENAPGIMELQLFISARKYEVIIKLRDEGLSNKAIQTEYGITNGMISKTSAQMLNLLNIEKEKINNGN